MRLAKSLGVRVLVTDMYRERPAYALADAHEVIDITDREATLAAARRHRVDGILCDTTDFGVPTAAYVAEKMDLPGIGYETALNCTDKHRMRSCVRQAGLRTPAYSVIRSEIELSQAKDTIGLPLLVKPVDNQSGRGVSIVSSEKELLAAFRQALGFCRSGTVLLEEFVAGVEIIVDGFAVAGNCVVLGVARKLPYDDNPTVSSQIVYESEWSLPCPAETVHAACASTMASVGLREGIFHAEFMVNADYAVPIDFAARGGGVFIYTRVIPHISGFNANRAMIELALGGRVHAEPPARRRAASIEFFRSAPGVLQRMVGVEDAARMPGIAAVHSNLEPGATIGALAHKDDRLGFIVALGESTDEVIAATRAAKGRLGVLLRGQAEIVPVL